MRAQPYEKQGNASLECAGSSLNLLSVASLTSGFLQPSTWLNYGIPLPSRCNSQNTNLNACLVHGFMHFTQWVVIPFRINDLSPSFDNIVIFRRHTIRPDTVLSSQLIINHTSKWSKRWEAAALEAFWQIVAYLFVSIFLKHVSIFTAAYVFLWKCIYFKGNVSILMHVSFLCCVNASIFA